MQEGKPISYASKTLTPSEINYAQIEKEMLAILFGCKHFHHYIYGREICVQTDHKPLVSIMQKSILNAPARLQRMILQLQRYNFKLVHVPGKVHFVHENIQVSDRRLEQIRLSTESVPPVSNLDLIHFRGLARITKRLPKLH